MPEHFHYENDALVNLETHHEKSDVNVRALLIFVVVFILFAVVTHILLYFMFQFFVRIENGRTNAPLTEIQRPAGSDVPALPRLQPFPSKLADGQTIAPNANTPVTDMEDMRAAEEKAQTTYGWVDQQKGVVRIPIDQAQQLLLQRGLPVVAAPTPAMTATAAPTNPGSNGGQATSPVPATATTGQAPAPLLHQTTTGGAHP